MIECRTGRIIKKKRKDNEYFFIRLNLIDTDNTDKPYSTKDIATGLVATKRNYSKANALLDNAITEYSADADRMLFDRYCIRWLDLKKPELKVSTYEGYEYRLNIIIEYFKEKKIRLCDLTPENIKLFYNHLLVVEHGQGKRKRIGYSSRSIKDIAILLRSLLEDAVTYKYISENPSAKIKIPKNEADSEKSEAYIDSEQVSDFLGEIKGHRLEVPFTLALFYGLRRSEICGLRWSALHNDGMLYIEHTVTRVKTTVAKDSTKSKASKRAYPIPNNICDRLQEIRDNQKRNKNLLGEEYHNSDYIFTWEDGTPYSPDYLTKSFKKLVRKSECLDSNLTLHNLRASCVSILVHNNTDLKDVQKWVGHKDMQTTINIYARTNKARQLKVADSMTNALFNVG